MPFDEAKADRAQNFFERVLVHTDGRWAGKPFILTDWQRDEIIRPLFGTVNEDGSRQYRTAYLEVGRKNGKSELASGNAVRYCLEPSSLTVPNSGRMISSRCQSVRMNGLPAHRPSVCTSTRSKKF